MRQPRKGHSFSRMSGSWPVKSEMKSLSPRSVPRMRYSSTARLMRRRFLAIGQSSSRTIAVHEASQGRNRSGASYGS